MKQHYPLNIFWSAEDEGFIAEAPDLPGCSAWGATEADAAREAQDAVAAWLQAAQAAGKALPMGRPVMDDVRGQAHHSLDELLQGMREGDMPKAEGWDDMPSVGREVP